MPALTIGIYYRKTDQENTRFLQFNSAGGDQSHVEERKSIYRRTFPE